MKSAQVIRLGKEWWKDERKPADGGIVKVQPQRKIPNSWFTVKQSADFMGTSIWFVYELIRANKIEAFRVGRCWRIGQDVVKNYLKDGRNGAA